MSPVIGLCLLIVASTCASPTLETTKKPIIEREDEIQQCIDNDALTRETFAAMERIVKISSYAYQSEKLDELERLEKHLNKMRQIIIIKGEEASELADCLDVQRSGVNESGVYTITPPGLEPMEVYCDMVTDGGGWTVVQRRQDGTVNFDRVFEDYRQGFGDRAGEFWLGNTALRGLTEDTDNVQLRIDMWDWEDNYRYATYNGFRVSGSDFTLSFISGSYDGTAGDSLSYHNGMGFTTRDHDVDRASGGNCGVWLYSGWWFDLCHRANLNGRYKNELDATTGMEQDQGIQWMAWKGNQYSLKKAEMKLRVDKTSNTYLADCAKIMASGSSESGVYTIASARLKPVEVYCDMESAGGGWTVFQKRENGMTDFDVSFEDYANGFGDASSEYWLGNDALRSMTDPERGLFELRIDLWDWNGSRRYATYQNFAVTGDNFVLSLGEYSGTLGDSLSYHNGMGFTTRDHDVDRSIAGNCGEWLYSGWWFNLCHRANLNGRYMNALDATTGFRADQGIQWLSWKGNRYSLMKSEMKFRPMM
ncbi:fibrinogen-like protein 1 [Acanthaster planci]|uniref:Fibrinogen-like protein 1 n=1 Tax=Acanthaster planci TaxID=133434 RepID=A0A8B7YPV8_ACAPL|nr:fibrinogen-like protein 1 [Acanthaster planci]XP_022094718.1 fibrinogen-like protein 1 [Acanthaster planci]